jgi:hypothetical protein
VIAPPHDHEHFKALYILLSRLLCFLRGMSMHMLSGLGSPPLQNVRQPSMHSSMRKEMSRLAELLLVCDVNPMGLRWDRT